MIANLIFGICQGKSEESSVELSLNGRCGEGLSACHEGYYCSKWG